MNTTFIKNFLKSPLQTGAVSRFSDTTIASMIRLLGEQTGIIMELGCGEGYVTHALDKAFGNVSAIIGIELNAEFVEHLQQQFLSNKKVKILYGDAGDRALFESYRPNCIVSTLPLLSLDEQTCDNILQNVTFALDNDGIFIQAQYTPLMSGLLKKYFEIIETDIVLQNIPPAILYKCRPKTGLL